MQWVDNAWFHSVTPVPEWSNTLTSESLRQSVSCDVVEVSYVL